MNNRRKLLIALGAGALAAPFGSFAQQQSKVLRIGFLGPGSASNTATRIDALRAGLRELGYVEGKNTIIEYRWADGKYELLPDLAAELVRLNVDLIVSHAVAGPAAAKQATATIPIVIAAGGDPVAAGIVNSLARPGGNVTGAAFFSEELGAKRMEMLKEAVPRVTRVGVLIMSSNAAMVSAFQVMESGAKVLKVGVQRFVTKNSNEFNATFAEMVNKRIYAIALPEDVLINLNLKTIADLAIRNRLPSVGSGEYAEAGGMMGYGVNIFAMFYRAAYFIDKIVKGTKPADIPIEQATKFDFVVNMKTAKALGIKFPQSILVQATKVIEK